MNCIRLVWIGLVAAGCGTAPVREEPVAAPGARVPIAARIEVLGPT